MKKSFGNIALCQKPDEINVHGLLYFLMKRMAPAKRAILLECQLIRRLSLILCSCIIPVLTLFTGQSHNITHPLKSPFTLVSDRKPENFFEYKAGDNFNRRNTSSISRIKI